MRIIRMMAVTAAALMVVAGCGSSDPGAGTWRASDSADAPYLELAEDGSLSGSDGCNQLSGTWSATDETVNFGETTITLKACEGVDTWLSGLSTATISGSDMTVLDASGTEIGTLHQAD